MSIVRGILVTIYGWKIGLYWVVFAASSGCDDNAHPPLKPGSYIQSSLNLTYRLDVTLEMTCAKRRPKKTTTSRTLTERFQTSVYKHCMGSRLR